MRLTPGSYIPAEVAIALQTELDAVKRVDMEMIRHTCRTIEELYKVVRVARRIARTRDSAHMCNGAGCACGLIEPLRKLAAFEKKHRQPDDPNCDSSSRRDGGGHG